MQDWDAFVEQDAANGTVFHTRSYLSYHEEGRFVDRSLVLHEGGKIVCVFAVSDRNGSLFSHAGTSYGGPVIHKKHYSTRSISNILNALTAEIGCLPAMRIAENVFFATGNDPLLYHLAKQRKVQPELGVFVDVTGIASLDQAIDRFSRARFRSRARALLRNGYQEPAPSHDYGRFYSLLEQNLKRHDTTPTHALDELKRLAAILGDRQQLIAGSQAGTWMIRGTQRCWHTFYIARGDAAVDGEVLLVLAQAMTTAAREGARYLNFGICTETRGQDMNYGLMSFKEGLGGQAVSRFTVY